MELLPEAYSESCESYKMQFFLKIVNNWNFCTFFTKSTMSDVWKVFQPHATDYLGVIPEASLELSQTVWSKIYDGVFLQKYLTPKSINYFCGKASSYLFDWVLNTSQNTTRKGQILQKENFCELTTKISRRKNQIIVIDFN